MIHNQFTKKYLGRYVDYDGSYGAQSLIAGTGILLSDGTYCCVEDLEAGDEVVAADGTTTNTITDNEYTTEPTYELRTWGGYLTGTLGHRMFSGGEQKELQKFKLGDKIDVPNIDEAFLREYDITEDEFRFLGFWLGDGDKGYRHKVTPRDEPSTVRVTVGTEKKLEYLRSLDVEFTERPHSNGKATQVILINRLHKKLQRIIGVMDGKRLPLLKNGYAQIIEGYIMADGSEKHGHHVISSINKPLLLSIQYGCWRLGYKAIISRRIDREYTNYCNNPKPMWKLSVNKMPKHSCDNNTVLSCGETGEEEVVYHTNTNGSHSYIADNYASHNCTDIMRQYTKEVHELSPYIAIPTRGNAKNIFRNFRSNKYYTKVLNAPTNMPKQGDIIFWGTYPLITGFAGHVGIVDSADVRNLMVFHQNYPTNSPCAYRKFNYRGVLGWLTRT